MKRITDEERRALLLEAARDVGNRARFEAGLTLRMAEDAEQAAREAERRRIASDDDEDRPGTFHLTRNPRRPHVCKIIPFRRS